MEMNIRIYVEAAEGSNDFTLIVNVVDPADDQPITTVATLDVNDTKLNVHLHDILNAFRMGAHFGRREIVR